MTQRQESTPNYNMNAVVKMTGVKAETIRSWERRYGLPTPERTPSGHRRYSEDDVALISWLSSQQQQGVSISSAVAQWRSTGGQMQAPLSSTATGSDRLEALCQQWIAACLDFDRLRAEQVLADAFAMFSPEQVSLGILLRGMVEMGNGWRQGEVTIQQEHFASALTMRRLENLLSSTPPPWRSDKIMLGCAPSDNHTFSPMLLTYLLRRQGWEVVYLGANVPVTAYRETVEQVQPALIILSAQRLHAAAQLIDVHEAIADQPVIFAYGGQIFNYQPELTELVPGEFLGRKMEDVPQQVESLLRTGGNPTMRKPLAPDLLALQESFVQRHTLVESTIWQTFLAQESSTKLLSSLNRELFEAIQASLKLGDLNLLSQDPSFLTELLVSYDYTDAYLFTYLYAYRLGLEAHLGSQGQPLIAWLDSLLAKGMTFSSQGGIMR